MAKMVSAIIPAYNEAGRIERALHIIHQVENIAEIIVIDDGSQDDTAKEARAFTHLVLMLPKNKGKSYAMHVGAARAQHDIILFCDADMYGFTPEDIEELLSPVISGTADMSVGLRSRPYFFSKFIPIAAQFSGLRAIQRAKWESMPHLFISGFQIELALYLFAHEGRWKTSYMHIPRLHHTIKEDKYGLWNGLRARINMITEILGLLVALYLPRKRAEQQTKDTFRYKKANRLLWE